jgi:hypothetical protein
MKKIEQKQKKKKIELSDKEESMRFIEKAKELHTKSTEERFEAACEKILRTKKKS